MQEKGKTISELKENEKNKEKTSNTYSQEDLEKLIEKHHQEVQRLKSLIVEKPQEAETVQEVPVKKVIQQVPQKNNGVL